MERISLTKNKKISYLLGELLESLFVKNFMLSMLSTGLVEFPNNILELYAIGRAILLFDIVKEILHIVQFDVTKEIEKEWIDSHQTGINNIFIVLKVSLDSSLYPVHLWAFSLEDFHLKFFMFYRDLFYGNELYLLNLDLFLCFYLSWWFLARGTI